MEEKKFVSYEDFGAVGDGKNDDLPAIVKAHEYANEKCLPVKACDYATYYLGGRDLTAIIKTPTDFGKARFIIDDRKLERITAAIFEIASDYHTYAPDIKSIEAGQKKLDFPHEGRTYVRVYTKDLRIFRRFGENENTGVDANDCFVVDGDGNIENDINWDYKTISKAIAKCIDDEPITVQGGIFTTIANQWEREYKYHNRGFNITRSNVTVQNIVHYIEGEGENGAPYASFFGITEAVDVTIQDCLLTPHKTYLTKNSTETYINRMGTYELGFNAAIRPRLIRVTQSRDITDTRYWGLIGTNFCKEIYIDGCEMSRFDAHMGVSGAVIKNSKLGHQNLSIIGYGEFVIENSSVIGYAFISLRGDYGSIWRGNVTVRNCVWYPTAKNSLTIISALNRGEHDFGYVATMPENILIDGLKVMDSEANEDTQLYILPNYDSKYERNKKYPYIPTKKLVARNITTECGRTPLPFEKPEMYEAIEYIIE